MTIEQVKCPTDGTLLLTIRREGNDAYLEVPEDRVTQPRTNPKDPSKTDVWAICPACGREVLGLTMVTHH